MTRTTDTTDVVECIISHAKPLTDLPNFLPFTHETTMTLSEEILFLILADLT